MKKLKVKVNFRYSTLPRKGPFSIFFVYPKDGEPFILKGGSEDLEEYLGTMATPAVVHVTYWKNGKCFTYKKIVNLSNNNVILVDRATTRDYSKYAKFFSDSSLSKKRYFIFLEGRERLLRGKTEILLASFRKFPRKWIRELNNIESIVTERKRLIRI